ncbi:MAG: hypothetical protein BWY63_02999 [Chloroflexi bacterium ADurb.Bin360]|nr:MAG: hypothetical protein BWY63_02999 [Chloroflexi bacterium ADurb.Bin360]
MIGSGIVALNTCSRRGAQLRAAIQELQADGASRIENGLPGAGRANCATIVRHVVVRDDRAFPTAHRAGGKVLVVDVTTGVEVEVVPQHRDGIIGSSAVRQRTLVGQTTGRASKCHIAVGAHIKLCLCTPVEGEVKTDSKWALSVIIRKARNRRTGAGDIHPAVSHGLPRIAKAIGSGPGSIHARRAGCGLFALGRTF